MGDLIRAVLASRNENKLRELQHALDGWSIELLDAQDYPPESGATYFENARGKAEFARTLALDRWVLGEDSGVEIEGLRRRPGRALGALGDGPGSGASARGARRRAGRGPPLRVYVCELVALSPDGAERRGTGVLEGRIAEELSGSEGFGFDPVFVPEGEDRTVAELGNAWKRDNSHRARAARALLASIMRS